MLLSSKSFKSALDMSYVTVIPLTINANWKPDRSYSEFKSL